MNRNDLLRHGARLGAVLGVATGIAIATPSGLASAAVGGGAFVSGTLNLNPDIGTGLWAANKGPGSAGEYTFNKDVAFTGAGVIGTTPFAGTLNVTSQGGYGFDNNGNVAKGGDTCVGGQAGSRPVDANGNYEDPNDGSWAGGLETPLFTATNGTGVGHIQLTGDVNAQRYGSIIIVYGTITAQTGDSAPYSVTLQLTPTTGDCATRGVTAASLNGPAEIGGPAITSLPSGPR
ncbi:MAG: hypothetical protein ACYDAY_03480 [Candidatus Dormibacteria bacterium]